MTFGEWLMWGMHALLFGFGVFLGALFILAGRQK